MDPIHQGELIQHLKYAKNVAEKRAKKEADEKAKEIVAAARDAAKEAAHAIEQKARSEAQILMENAQREIKAAEEKAAANLRRESADLAVALAGRLLSENLDTDKNRQLIDGLINEV